MKCPKCNHYFAPRSNRENAYYWGVVIELLREETGNDKDTLHEELKKQFLWYVDKVDDFGNKYKQLVSTTDLTTVEMEDYLSQIRMWASEYLNINIPQPNEPLDKCSTKN